MRSLWLDRVLAKGRSLLSRSRDGLEQRRESRGSQFDRGSSGDSAGHWGRRTIRSKVDGAGLRMGPGSSGDLSFAGGASGADLEISLLNHALPEYEILEMLDRGGQGTVYRAVQKSTGRLVALKVLHFDPHASRTRLQRFEREVALVARLRHPHVVTIYDRGLISDRPYLSMELIDGLPIDDFILLNRPSVAECVALFEKVCRAVASVHQRGVIHRDLKPSNILVDLEGQPHILDFGLAKSFDDEPGESSLSVAGQVIGTLPYLSPEQVAGEEGGVDIRTDIYSLGVILHLLLTGSMPYSVSGSVDQVRRNIADQIPATLERRGGTDADGCAVGAISSDLSHIVLKTLAKDKARRYQSADALADDLRRYQEGDAVAARGDGGWYLLRKTARRYRVHAIVAGAFVLLLGGWAVSTTMLWKNSDRIARHATSSLEMGRAGRLGSLARDEGRISDGVRHCENVIEIFQNIRDPNLDDFRSLYSAHHELAQIYFRDPDQLRASMHHCEAAVKIASSLVTNSPSDPAGRRLLAYSLRLQGRLALKLKSWSEAQLRFDLSSHQFQLLSLKDTDKEDPNCVFESDYSNQLLGQSLLKGGERQSGLGVLLAARASMIRVHAIAPRSMDYLFELLRTDALIAVELLRGRTPTEDCEALGLLRDAESRLREALADGRATPRMLAVQELRDIVTENLAVVNGRLTKWTSTQRPSDYASSSESGTSTGSSSPSSVGSGASDFQNE